MTTGPATTPSASMPDVAARIRRLVDQQDAWRMGTLNLIASENRMSPAAQALLDTDLAGRVAMSVTGPRPFPGVRAVQHIAPLWQILEELAARLLGVRFVDIRPQGVTQANLIALAAVTTPGDTIAVQAMRGGGSEGYNAGGVPDYLGLRVVTLPSTDELNIDLEGAAAVIRAERPRSIVIGGMKVLFPYPIAGLRAVADEIGATIIFDAAHLVPLIATDIFQRPVAEGAHIITAGTHKMAGGSMGGLLGTSDAALWEQLREVAGVFVEGRDINKVASSAHAFAEMVEFAQPYSAACVANARALGQALEAEGWGVLGSDRGYTQTHQVMLRLGGLCHALEAIERCGERDIFLSVVRLPGDPAYPGPAGAVRISTQELTRLGLEPADMPRVAQLVSRALRLEGSVAEARADVAALGLAARPMRFVLG